MSPRRVLRLPLLLAASCWLLGSCAILGGGEEHVGGHATLGQAAAAANPDSTGRARRLNVGHHERSHPDTETEIEITESSSDPGSAPGVSERFSNQHFVVGLVGGAGAVAGHRYDGFGDLGISFGVAEERLGAAVVLSASPIEFASQTIAGQSFVDEIELNFEVNGRYTLSPTHAFFGPYVLAGFRFSSLLWDYARPVPILEDGEKRDVTSDQIEHWAVFGGAGVALLHGRHLQAGFQVLGGARFYAWETEAGFSNTLFPPAGFALGRFELGWKF